jgi:hypothetical protein
MNYTAHDGFAETVRHGSLPFSCKETGDTRKKDDEVKLAGTFIDLEIEWR